MTSTKHATFTIERYYDAPPARVFAAWANPEIKYRWFACHGDWVSQGYGMDFRVGGREWNRTGPKDGTVHAYDACYHDIVDNERIVLAYDMHLDRTRISVSLLTLEFRAEGPGTRLVFTEQGAFLDGYDDVAGREEGSRIGLENLAAELERSRAA